MLVTNVAKFENFKPGFEHPHLLPRDTGEEDGGFEGTERPSHHRYKPVPNGVGADSAHLFPRELKKLSRPNLTAPRLEIKRNVKQ
jgi:hypothetical protein